MNFSEIYDTYKDDVVEHTQEQAVETPGAPETHEEVGGGENIPPSTDMGVASLSEYFGLSNAEVRSSGTRGLVNEIYELVKDLEGDDVEGALMEIEQKIGEPKMGVSRMEHVYRYLRLADQAKQAYKQVKRYEAKGGAGKQREQDTIRATSGNDEGGDEAGNVGADS